MFHAFACRVTLDRAKTTRNVMLEPIFGTAAWRSAFLAYLAFLEVPSTSAAERFTPAASRGSISGLGPYGTIRVGLICEWE
jgi:hypothetical protein